MRYFLCLVDSTGRGVSPAFRRQFESLPRRYNLDSEWADFENAAVLTAWDDPSGDPLIARCGDCVGVGTVRLDNRSELEKWADGSESRLTDLELVMRIVALHGTEYIARILGDFAFVVWHPRLRNAVAATDAFAVRKLYYAQPPGCFGFASRAEGLAIHAGYDTQFLAERVAGCVPSPGLSPYPGVRQLDAGCLGICEHGRFATRTYWSPQRFETDQYWTTRTQEAADACRALLADSVRQRLGPRGTTWAQLSGGMDSSSIVSVAAWMAESSVIPEGLAGTVTYVDRQGTDSDERVYSDEVVARWGVRNEMIVDPPFWLEDAVDPPLTDYPRESLALYPRECRLVKLVKGSGGRILLTGFAGDELFTGTMYFFADWLMRGRIVATVREMARRAAIGRASFWELGYVNAFLPLVPAFFRVRFPRNKSQLVPWIAPAVIREHRLRKRATVAETYAGRLGKKYHHAVVTNVIAISRQLDGGFLGDCLDVRYPFLSRPLVEFALQLPPELCARAQARKWVLREAMRGILPELVRTRIGKGGVAGLLGWSLTTQQALLEPLLKDPILGQLGVINTDTFRKAFHNAPQLPRRSDHIHTWIQLTLLLEAWLQLRSGRWPPKRRVDSRQRVRSL